MPCSRQQTVFFKGGYRVLHIFVAEINCQGRYDLADRLDNHNSAPNEYISGGGSFFGGTVAIKLRVGVGAELVKRWMNSTKDGTRYGCFQK